MHDRRTIDSIGHHSHRQWLVLVGLWLVVGVLGAAIEWATRAAGGVDERLASLALSWGVWSATGIALTPPIILAARTGLERPGTLLRLLPLHVALVATVVAVHQLLSSAVVGLFVRFPPSLISMATLLRVQPKWWALEATIALAAYLIIVARFCAREAEAHWSRLESRTRELEKEVFHLRARARHVQISALRQEINPHFLLNTLNSIAGCARHARVDDVVLMIARLGELLRASIDPTLGNEVPLSEELRLLHLYVAIEQLRFGDRLRLKLDIAPGVDEALVPPLILQPIVENSVRHGLARTAHGGTVRVRARRRLAALEITISDSGAGRQVPRSGPTFGGLGLANTRARLATMYGSDGSVVLRTGPDAELGGMDVVLTLPIRRLRGAASAPSRDEVPGDRDYSLRSATFDAD